MGIRITNFSLEEFYHLYSRGVDKRSIFLDSEDQKRFARLLYLSNGNKPVVYRSIRNTPLGQIDVGDELVAIGAYCLMPNHFHLLVKEVTEGGIVKFMSKLLTSYSMYFNTKYKRTGALFGSEFKSTHLDTDEYLKYMYSYIHLNPIKLIDPRWKEDGISNAEEVESFLNKYIFSSYKDYAGEKREVGLILNKIAFPDYFFEDSVIETHIKDWLEFTKGSPW
jgi:putative transposase